MPIEFHCEHCGRLMRTPDSTAGKKGKCPGCAGIMHIPAQSTASAGDKAGTAVSSTAAAKTNSPAASSSSSPDDRIVFHCGSCQKQLRIPAAHAGKKGKCPHCKSVMQIPTESEKGAAGTSVATAAAPTAAASTNGERIEFPCPGCSRKMRTPASAAGKKGKCPHCGSVVAIPVASQIAGSVVQAAPNQLTELPATGGLTPLGSGEPVVGGLQPLGGADSFGGGLEPIGGGGLDALGGGLEPLGGGAADPFGGLPAANDPFSMPAGAADPFGGVPTTNVAAAGVNPYQAPAATPKSTGRGKNSPASHGQVEFNETFQAAWSIFSENLGSCILYSITLIALVSVCVGLVFGIFMVGTLIAGVSAQSAASSGAEGPPTGALALLGVTAIISMLVGALLLLLVAPWLQAGTLLFFTKMCRGQESRLGLLFEGGPYMFRVLGSNFLIGLMTAPVMFASVGLAILVDNPLINMAGNLLTNLASYGLFLFFGLSPYLIVDRDAGVIESLKDSVDYMNGNKGQAFGLHLVAGMAVGTINTFTCGLGALATIPFMVVLQAVIYLKATGVRTAELKGRRRR